MPLSLATDKTCVVLAGDHLQMGQKVYSVEARELKFNLSIVERLYGYYEQVAPLSSARGVSLPRCLLKTNYRNHSEILSFISSVYYGGPNVLVSRTSQPPSSETGSPMNFYAACGQEMQDPNSTSWYNLAEISETVERVGELYQSWPPSWGERDAKAILVTTAYSDQVNNVILPCMTGLFVEDALHALMGVRYSVVRNLIAKSCCMMN
jgi:superfamily I DNA and/or RNA helicase